MFKVGDRVLWTGHAATVISVRGLGEDRAFEYDISVDEGYVTSADGYELVKLA